MPSRSHADSSTRQRPVQSCSCETPAGSVALGLIAVTCAFAGAGDMATRYWELAFDPSSSITAKSLAGIALYVFLEPREYGTTPAGAGMPEIGCWSWVSHCDCGRGSDSRYTSRPAPLIVTPA